MTVRVDLSGVLLFLGVALLPVYVFGSGGIQPAHAVLTAFIGSALMSYGFKIKVWAALLGAMFVHSAFVEGVYSIRGGDPWLLINSVYFLYNFLLSVAVYEFVRRNGLGAIKSGLMIAAIVAVGTVVLSGVDLREMADTGRATGTFNNPNQLGYFSVCLLSLTYLLYRHGELSYRFAVLLFLASLFLSIASLSKAAMVANFAVIFLALKPLTSRSTLVLWAGLTAVAMAVVFWMASEGFFDDYLFMQRLANMAYESDSSLASRGYLAFLEGNTLQFLVGLGSARVDEIVGHEVHSTLGAVFNVYGALGLLLFGGSFAIWAVSAWRHYGLLGLVCIVGPAMLYGLTHNGTRFTIFWLLVAVSFASMAQGEVWSRARLQNGSRSCDASSVTL